MKVYISGPMTGRSRLNYEAFLRAAAELWAQGHEPVNPHDLNAPTMEYAEAMRVDLRALLDCDAIHMLAGWEESRGASLERAVAMTCGIPLV